MKLRYMQQSASGATPNRPTGAHFRQADWQGNTDANRTWA